MSIVIIVSCLILSQVASIYQFPMACVLISRSVRLTQWLSCLAFTSQYLACKIGTWDGRPCCTWAAHSSWDSMTALWFQVSIARYSLNAHMFMLMQYTGTARGHPVLMHVKFSCQGIRCIAFERSMLHHALCLTLCRAVVYRPALRGVASGCMARSHPAIWTIVLCFLNLFDVFFVDVTVQVLHVHQSQHFTKECPPANWSERCADRVAFESMRPPVWRFSVGCNGPQKAACCLFSMEMSKTQLEMIQELLATQWDVMHLHVSRSWLRSRTHQLAVQLKSQEPQAPKV